MSRLQFRAIRMRAGQSRAVHLRAVSAALAITAALTMSGCSLVGKEPASNPAGSASAGASGASGAASGAASGSKPGGAVNADAVNIDPDNLPPSLGTVTVPAVVKDDPAATMEVNLLGLRRQDKVVVATYSFVVKSDKSTTARWLYSYLGDKGWKPTLVDTKNLKLHDVLEGDGGKAMTESQGSMFAPGQTYFAYAAFAAPPADVTDMTVKAVDGGAAFLAVPLQ